MVETALATTCKKMEKVVDECNIELLATQGRVEQAFTLAAGITQLKAMITPEMMKSIMELQGTALGFCTDKDPEGGYPVDTVRDCFLEACLRGFHPINNEFNIIVGRFYGTKNGYVRLVGEFPGLTDLRYAIGVAKSHEGGAVVECKAAWRIKGRKDRIEPSPGNSNDAREIAIRINKGMGIDAIVGKATRKLHALIYAQLTGSKVEYLPEGDVAEVIDVEATPGAEAPLKRPQAKSNKKPADKKPDKPAPSPVADPTKPMTAAQIATAALKMPPKDFQRLSKDYGLDVWDGPTIGRLPATMQSKLVADIHAVELGL